ncbi:Mbeg1-like protein [Sphingorhabdus arenilitoris]|uniref:Mbeg1-like protein n=1 Tax=Sphingorhabdus arenilitoris TaxID=1490041 RepID=A0ABV8RJW5_9SPHN
MTWAVGQASGLSGSITGRVLTEALRHMPLVPRDIIADAILAIPSREIAAYALPSAAVKLATAGISALQSSNAPAAGPQPRDLALLAQDVYRDRANPPSGYRAATPGDLGALGLNPQDLSSTQSAFKARVYVTGTGADTQYVVSFRGSQSASDWRSNFQQSVGLSTDNYRKALEIGQKIALYGNGNVTFTGHSLGGGLASAAAISGGIPAVTFNASGLSAKTIKTAEQMRMAAGVEQAGAVDAYYVRGEILSLIQDGGDRFIGGVLGGLLGAAVLDAPEAYGRRIGIDAVRPEGVKWYQDNPAARHGIAWVISSV